MKMLQVWTNWRIGKEFYCECMKFVQRTNSDVLRYTQCVGNDLKALAEETHLACSLWISLWAEPLALMCCLLVLMVLHWDKMHSSHPLKTVEELPLWLSRLRTGPSVCEDVASPLALFSGLRISCCHSCSVGCRSGSSTELLWLWCRPAAAAPFWPLAQELPFATDESFNR